MPVGRPPPAPHQFAWGRERFLDEARTLARLDRSAIVRVHDFLEANGTAYMVMTLVEGETLNKRLMRDQRLTPGTVERLIFPLLDGLEAVHAIGFLHRDIKPANIMVDDQGRPTLIDFGASYAPVANAAVVRSRYYRAVVARAFVPPFSFSCRIAHRNKGTCVEARAACDFRASQPFRASAARRNRTGRLRAVVLPDHRSRLLR